MNNLKLVGPDNKKLSTVCTKIAMEDMAKAVKFAKRMLSFLGNRIDGVGLSANQVGRTDRTFVISIMGLKEMFINPIVTELSKKKTKLKEGCLSYPGKVKAIKRPENLIITYFNGKKMIKTPANGIIARIILHEMDHLEGTCKVK